MRAEQRSSLRTYIDSLIDVPWFALCGKPDASVIVAADLVEAWDRWNSEMLAVWLPETHALERLALSQLGESGVEAIFEAVSRDVGDRIAVSMEQYFERRPSDSEFAMTNTDRGLRPEWLETVKRDLCWAGVEAVLAKPGFFCVILPYYRAGRWPCAWENADRTKRVVLL